MGKISLNRSQFSNEPSIGFIELGIRPESLQINRTERKKTVNSKEAQIEEISFFGDFIQYKVLINSEFELLVSEMHSNEIAELKTGDRVSVSWNSDSFVIFL